VIISDGNSFTESFQLNDRGPQGRKFWIFIQKDALTIGCGPSVQSIETIIANFHSPKFSQVKTFIIDRFNTRNIVLKNISLMNTNFRGKNRRAQETFNLVPEFSDFINSAKYLRWLNVHGGSYHQFHMVGGETCIANKKVKVKSVG